MRRPSRGPLAHLLRNRFYIGEVMFKGEVLPGEQPAILERELFDAVQAKLNEQRNNHTVARSQSESVLIGRIYDDRGNRMTPSHVRNGGIKYRYYLSLPLLHGQPGRVGSVRRVPAAEIEALVGQAVRKRLGDPASGSDRDLISSHVVRVEVQADQLAVKLNRSNSRLNSSWRSTSPRPKHLALKFQRHCSPAPTAAARR
jgi:site-specific DNA recombinase